MAIALSRAPPVNPTRCPQCQRDGASCLLVGNKMILSPAATRKAWTRHPRQHYRAWRKLTGSALLLFLRWGKHLCCAMQQFLIPCTPKVTRLVSSKCIWMSSSLCLGLLVSVPKLVPHVCASAIHIKWKPQHGFTPSIHIFRAKKGDLWPHIERGGHGTNVRKTTNRWTRFNLQQLWGRRCARTASRALPYYLAPFSPDLNVCVLGGRQTRKRRG